MKKAILFCGTVALLAFPVAFILTFIKQRLVAVTITGASMEPTYRDGQRVLVRRNQTPAVGQVIVAEHPVVGREWDTPPITSDAGTTELSDRSWIIKRVVAVAGDPAPNIEGLSEAGGRVPAGSLVLLGDNVSASADSRAFGYFQTERVLGVAIRRLT